MSLSSKPTRRDRKRDRTTTHLSQAAFELFEKHGYSDVTMEQIAEAADVSKVTLYKYFPVKEALLAHRFKLEIVAGTKSFGEQFDRRAPFVTRMQQLLSASAAWNESRKDLMPHYVKFRFSQAGSGSRYRSGVYAILERLFHDAQSTGAIRSDVPASELAWMLEMSCFGAVVAWLNNDQLSLKHRFHSVLDVMLNGISLRTAAKRASRSESRRRR